MVSWSDTGAENSLWAPLQKIQLQLQSSTEQLRDRKALLENVLQLPLTDQMFDSGLQDCVVLKSALTRLLDEADDLTGTLDEIGALPDGRVGAEVVAQVARIRAERTKHLALLRETKQMEQLKNLLQEQITLVQARTDYLRAHTPALLRSLTENHMWGHSLLDSSVHLAILAQDGGEKDPPEYYRRHAWFGEPDPSDPWGTVAPAAKKGGPRKELPVPAASEDPRDDLRPVACGTLCSLLEDNAKLTLRTADAAEMAEAIATQLGLPKEQLENFLTVTEAELLHEIAALRAEERAAVPKQLPASQRAARLARIDRDSEEYKQLVYAALDELRAPPPDALAAPARPHCDLCALSLPDYDAYMDHMFEVHIKVPVTVHVRSLLHPEVLGPIWDVASMPPAAFSLKEGAVPADVTARILAGKELVRVLSAKVLEGGEIPTLDAVIRDAGAENLVRELHCQMCLGEIYGDFYMAANACPQAITETGSICMACKCHLDSSILFLDDKNDVKVCSAFLWVYVFCMQTIFANCRQVDISAQQRVNR